MSTRRVVPALTAPGSIISGKTGRRSRRRCETCLKPLAAAPSSSQKRFCSDRCRLLAWAVGALASALEAGKAEGLRSHLEALLRER